MKNLLILSLLVFSINQISFAQIELSLNVAHEFPVDEYKWIYKPSNNYQFSILKNNKYKKRRNSGGLVIGYSNLKVKEDIFYYSVNENEYGTISYSNFQTFQILGRLKRDFIINKSIEIFGGIDAGFQQIFFSYSSKDPYSDTDQSFSVAGGLASLQSGISFLISQNLSLSLFGRGSLSIAPVSSNNKEVFNYLVAPGTGINFRF